MHATDDFRDYIDRVRGWSQHRRREYFAGLNDGLQEFTLANALLIDDLQRQINPVARPQLHGTSAVHDLGGAGLTVTMPKSKDGLWGEPICEPASDATGTP